MPTISLRSSRFFLVLAILTFLPQVLLFWVAEAVSGVLIAILVSLESFIVFFLAAAVGLEKLYLQRFFGLLLGVVEVVLLLIPFFDDENSAGGIHWILIAMIIPACFASESILLSLSKAVDADLIALIAIILGISTVVLFGAAMYLEGLVPLDLPPGNLNSLS